MDRFSLPGKYLHQIREVNTRVKVDFALLASTISLYRLYGGEC
jgi:hypothetical protein